MSLRRDGAVTVATVLLALAGGVALGGGPLQGGSDATVTADDSSAVADLRAQVGSLESARAFDDAYAQATAAQVLGGGLRGRAVTVVALPGADPERVADVTRLVRTAGGTVAVQAEVQPTLLDVGRRQLVAELARQTQESARPPVEVPDGAGDYDVAARLLGHALLDPANGGSPEDRTGERVLAGFTTAELLSTAESVTRRGSVALVVAGPPTGSVDERQGTASIVAALVTGFEVSGDGVVLAGPAAAGATDGVVGALHAEDVRRKVSTVDALDSPAGAVVAVRALVGEARGRTGHYGSGTAEDGILPR